MSSGYKEETAVSHTINKQDRICSQATSINLPRTHMHTVDGRLILSVWLSSKHSMLMSLQYRSYCHILYGFGYLKVYALYILNVRLMSACCLCCSYNAFWLSSLTFVWAIYIWIFWRFFTFTKKVKPTSPESLTIYSRFEWMCIAWFDRKSTDKRAQASTKQRVRVTGVECVWVCRAYAQWKLPLKLTNNFEWMVKIRSYTCFGNRKHLNGIKQFRLLIPGAKYIECVAFFDLIKITLKSIFLWNVTNSRYINEWVGGKCTIDDCIADYSNNANRQPFVKSLLIRIVIVVVAIFTVVVLFSRHFLHRKSLHCWLIGFDGSRCISINKSIRLGSVRLGWVEFI